MRKNFAILAAISGLLFGVAQTPSEAAGKSHAMLRNQISYSGGNSFGNASRRMTAPNQRKRRHLARVNPSMRSKLNLKTR